MLRGVGIRVNPGSAVVTPLSVTVRAEKSGAVLVASANASTCRNAVLSAAGTPAAQRVFPAQYGLSVALLFCTLMTRPPGANGLPI